MKRMIVVAAGAAALGVVLFGAGPAAAQQPGVSPGGFRVAVVNMDVVRKGYKKIEFYKQELQNLAKPYEGEIKKYKEWYEQWNNVAQTSANKEEKEKAAKQVVLTKRTLEDKMNEANKKIMDVSQRQVLQVYREIEDVIESYAKANGIHMVLHYADPVDPSEKYSAANIHRKLNGCSNVGAAGPIYVAPNIDISQDIVNVLNQRYPATAATTPTSVAPTGN